MEVNRETAAYANHPYVRTIASNGDIYYTDEFYAAMREKIDREDMTYVEAYNALGFDTGVLTENRANAAGKRAMKMAKVRKAFEQSPAEFDSDIAFEEMMGRFLNGSMTHQEFYSSMAARLIFLEEFYKALKKTTSSLSRERIK